MAVKGLREITAIALLFVANAFFGISNEITAFMFPAFGEDVYKVINFYTNVLGIIGVAFALVLTYRHLRGQPLDLPQIPSTPVVILNYLIFFIISNIIITWLLTGVIDITRPSAKSFVEQTIIAANENTIIFILLVSIIPLGAGIGDARFPTVMVKLGIPQLPWKISLRRYDLRFNPPNLDRMIYAFYGIVIGTLLHAGRYSYQASTPNQFYSIMLIAFVMFTGFWWIKESFGFGACIATHASWNIILVSLKGSLYTWLPT